MTEPVAVTADQVALIVRDALYDAAHKSERSLQSADFRLGVSDLGLCHEKARRMILQIPFDEEEEHYLPSFIGTAIGDHAEAALAKAEGWIVQQELDITLPSINGNPPRTVRGHSDAIVPEWNALFDFKAPGNVATVARAETKLSYRFQRHLYFLGAVQAGLLQEEGGIVGNIYIDRTGEQETPHVDLEPFSWDVVREAAEWLDDVIYAVVNQEEAKKDPGVEFCEGWCPYFLSCRALDNKADGGLITDETALVAVKEYLAARDDEKDAAMRKASARRTLMGINGSTGEHAVRWVHQAETEVSASVRAAYDRLSITRLRKRKDTTA